MDLDAAYLVLPKEKSRITGYYYFGKPGGQLNGPIHIECRTVNHVVVSVVEVETAGVFHNYYTKHNPTVYHRHMRHRYIKDITQVINSIPSVL